MYLGDTVAGDRTDYTQHFDYKAYSYSGYMEPGGYILVVAGYIEHAAGGLDLLAEFAHYFKYIKQS